MVNDGAFVEAIAESLESVNSIRGKALHYLEVVISMLFLNEHTKGSSKADVLADLDISE